MPEAQTQTPDEYLLERFDSIPSLNEKRQFSPTGNQTQWVRRFFSLLPDSHDKRGACKFCTPNLRPEENDRTVHYYYAGDEDSIPENERIW